MKCVFRISKAIAVVVASGALLNAVNAFAEDERVRLDDLRAQLSANAQGKRAEDIDAFAIVEGDVDNENQQLAAKEKELVAKLEQKSAAPAGFVVQGRELGVAPTADNTTAKVKSIEPDEGPGVLEAVRKESDAQKAKEIAALKDANGDLNRKLSQSQKKLSDSQRDLKESKDRLMMAEAEIQRLSQMLERRSMDGLAKGRVSLPVAASAPVVRPAVSVAPKQVEDLPVATVVVEKANLRTGPGTENSSLMSVSRGTRLVVETRNGSWYRVFAPNGARAWVTGDVLSFTPNTPSESGIGSALRVRAYDPGSEGSSRGQALN